MIVTSRKLQHFEGGPATMKLLLAATLWRCSLCHRLKDPRDIAAGTRLLERRLDRPPSRGGACGECAGFLVGKWEEGEGENAQSIHS